MSFKQSNYWLNTVTLPTATSGDLPARVDVAIVGSGFTGLSAARMLAKRGARVAVLEANTIGWGASSRNGGMVLTGMKVDVETLVARYGMETAKRMYAASLASIAVVEQIFALRPSRGRLQAVALRRLRPFGRTDWPRIQPSASRHSQE
jgi:glycine/D-amino acid oxidase-like deaminating enzyme